MESIKKKLEQNKKQILIIKMVLIMGMFIAMSISMLTSYASVDTSKPFLELANGYDQNDPDFDETIQSDYEDYNVIPVKLYLGGFETVNSLDINFSYDSELLTPVYWKRNQYVEATSIGNAFISADKVSVVESDTQCSYLFKDESRIRFQAIANYLNPNGKVLLGSFYFQINDGYSLEDITSKSFNLTKGASGLPDGLEINYNSVTEWVLGDNYFKVSGFSSDEEVKISEFTVTDPSRLNYEHGDKIDFAGSMVTIIYSNNTTYQEPLAKAIEDKKVTVDNTIADVKNPNFTIRTVEDTTKSETISLTVTDPVDLIRLSTSPSTTSYQIGKDISLDGGIVEVKTKSGAVSNINLPDNRVISDTFVADITSPNIQGNKWITTEGLQAGNQKITLSYTDDNGVTKTTSFTITVNDTISGIVIKNKPTKKIYKYGDAIDLTDGKITVSTVGGSHFDLSMTDGSVNVTGYDATPTSFPSSQNLSVSYAGKVAPTTIPITVKNYVKDILLINPRKMIYKYGDTIDLTNGSYHIKYANGEISEAIPLKVSDLSTYSMKQIGSQEITVSYKDSNPDSYTYGKKFTKTFTIHINDYVTRIEITNPTDISFYYGATFNFKGGKIEAYYASKPTTAVEIPMTSAMFRQADGSAIEMSPESDLFDKKTQKYQESLEISVTRGGITKTSNYSIDIINDVKSIEMHIIPKTDYNVKEVLDLTKDGTQVGEILVKRAVGIKEAVSLKDSRVKVTGFDSTSVHENLPLTVTFEENKVNQTTQYYINVKDSVKSIRIDSENPPKADYKYNEGLDRSIGKIMVEYGSGEQPIPLSQATVTELDGKPFDSTNLTTRNLLITYGGKTLTYSVTVSDYVKGIILTKPSKEEYEYGEDLDLAGGSVQAVMASGAATSPVELSDNSVTLSPFQPKQEGTQSIQVTYEGFTQSFGVTVKDSIQTITISSLPTKREYRYGEALSVAGGKITATKTSGKIETITITTSMVIGYEPNKLGKQSLTVSYKGKKANYDVNVEDYMRDISIVKPEKLVYKLGESIDLTGGQVNVVMASGKATSSVAMSDTDVKVIGFNSTSEGAKQIKVTYKGFTKTFGITVVDELSSMRIKTLPNKLDYRYGESLDVASGTIEIEKESGAKQVINITNAMVTGYNPKKLGSQTLTVTYQGFTQQFIVNVEDYVSELKVQPPIKVEYEYGEDLNLTGGEVSILMASGKTEETVVLTASMVSGFDAIKEGKQTIKVEYKGLQGNFQVNVVDKIKGISLNTQPNKKIYQYGESLDVIGATIKVIKSSGISIVPVTKDMISNYDANQEGLQLVTVNYGRFTANFTVLVKKPADNPSDTPNNNPTDKPSNNSSNKRNESSKKDEKNINTNINRRNLMEQMRETEAIEEWEEVIVDPMEEVTEETENMPIVESSSTKKSKQEKESSKEKPTKTLGVRDEKYDNSSNGKFLAEMIGLIGAFILFIPIAMKRNVKICVEEDGNFVLGGLNKISSKKLKLNVNPYLDGETYEGRVKIILSKSISKELNGKILEIKHRNHIIKHEICYDNKPYEIILK